MTQKPSFSSPGLGSDLDFEPDVEDGDIVGMDCGPVSRSLVAYEVARVYLAGKVGGSRTDPESPVCPLDSVFFAGCVSPSLHLRSVTFDVELYVYKPI